MRRARSQDFSGTTNIENGGSSGNTNTKNTFRRGPVSSSEMTTKTSSSSSSSNASSAFPTSVASRYSQSQPSMVRRLSHRSRLSGLLKLDDLSRLPEAEDGELTLCKSGSVPANDELGASTGSDVGTGVQNSRGRGGDSRIGIASEVPESSGNEVLSWMMDLRGSPRFAVANLSVLLLLLLTVTNIALDVVHAQIHRLDSPYDYDALSAEVIVPPFKYTSSVSDTSRRPRPGLGSAAIGSLTDALSPILPFTGGVDLRRAEGIDEWRDALSSFLGSLRVPWIPLAAPSTVVAGVPRSGAQPSGDDLPTPRGTPHTHGSFTMISRRPLLAESDPFLPRHKIAQLTLGDISTAFLYIIQANREGVENDIFRNTLSPRAREMALAIEDATATSRGHGVYSAHTRPRQTDTKEDQQIGEVGPLSPSAGYGDIDALQFCAAMRIFAEWRLLRQVPDGYKGYAVGMSLGHKDIVQNLAKIEGAVHAFIDLRADQVSAFHTNQREDDGLLAEENSIIRSPTLRELLCYEIESGINPSSNLPRLREKSAAMGLLWVRRQFHYQTSIFSNILNVPEVHNTARDAVSAAYSEVYNAFHGWAVQKIFNYSFQAAPDANVIYRFMNPAHLEKVTNAAISGEIEFQDGEAPQILASTDVQIKSEKKRDLDDAAYVSMSTISAPIPSIDAVHNEIKNTTMEKIASISPNIVDTSPENTENAVVSGNVSRDVLPSKKENIESSVLVMNVSSPQTIKEQHHKDKTNCNATQAEIQEGGSNPFLKLGLRISSEWDKFGKHLGGEWDKFEKHLSEEWDKLGKHVGGEIDKFGDDLEKLGAEFNKMGKQVGGEWDKLVSNVVRVFDKTSSHSSRGDSVFDVRGGADRANINGADQAGNAKEIRRGLKGDELELYVSHQMLLDAKQHIVKYLDIAMPLLKDLEGLFDEMNMDDPTKV